ncbi:MAG: hypothetical protein U0O29_03385 [Oscillospiraceae bacterium]
MPKPGSVLLSRTRYAFRKPDYYSAHIRRLTITANRLVGEDTAQQEPEAPVQFNLFDNVEVQEQRLQEEEAKLKRERKIQEAMLDIKKKFGKNAILNGGSYLEGATAKERNKQIGGHKA